MSKTVKVFGKTVKLLPILAMAIIGVVGVGAAVFLMFSAGGTATYTTKGLTGEFLSPTFEAYDGHDIAFSTLSQAYHITATAPLQGDYDKCFITVITAKNLGTTETLKLSVKLLKAGVPIDPLTYNVLNQFTAFHLTGGATIQPLTALNGMVIEDNAQTWIIANGDISKLMYKVPAIDTSISSGILTDIDLPTEYLPNFPTQNIDVELTLSVVTP